MSKNLLMLITAVAGCSSTFAQCADTSNIYSFLYAGKTYELIRENKTWEDAAACAVERGGMLAEINDADEQNAIFSELMENASIDTANTVAPDGGFGSYVWIGGNDLNAEGNWIWDGDNDQTGTPFWEGTSNGSAVGGQYSNWGNEPDNWNEQDGLGLAITDWLLGNAGQWNDVFHTNTLYFIVEYSPATGILDNTEKESLRVYPNPFTDFLKIENLSATPTCISILNALGEEVKFWVIDNSFSGSLDLSALQRGIYFLQIQYSGGATSVVTIVK